MTDSPRLPPVKSDDNFIFPWSDKAHSISSSPGHDIKLHQDSHATHSLSMLDPCDTGDAVELPWKVFTKDGNPRAVVVQLLRDSWCLFKHLCLDDWVQQAMGKEPAAIAVFNTYYNRLSYSLYNFLRQYPMEAEKYDVIAKTLQQNDPFLSMAVAHALHCCRTLDHFESFVLGAHFITLPLKRLLTCPDKHVLLRLAALEVRYDRYRTSPSLARGDEFPVDTDLLLSVSEHSAKVIALQLSEEALREFHQLNTRSVLVNDDVLRRLGAQWDRLCRETEEIVAVQELIGQMESLTLVGSAPSWRRIADDGPQNLFHLRNFFSLSAVLSGMSFAGKRPESISHLFDLVDSEANYRLYRTTLHAEPSLPFLYPLIVDYKRGNQRTLLSVFSFLRYHHFLEEATGHRASRLIAGIDRVS